MTLEKADSLYAERPTSQESAAMLKRLDDHLRAPDAPKENRRGVAVGLLMDAVTQMNNQGDIAKRIDAFIITVHPAECVDLPDAPSDDAAIAALRELVECKDMHDKIENRGNGITAEEAKALSRRYRGRRPVAWQRARDVLAGTAAPRAEAVSRDERQARVVEFVRTRFGAANMDGKERAARVLEEALEIAQVEGMTIAEIAKLGNHVFSKPVGQAAQEAAGTGVALLAYCASLGESADELEAREVERLFSMPAEYFRARHAAKAAAGVALAGLKPKRQCLRAMTDGRCSEPDCMCPPAAS